MKILTILCFGILSFFSVEEKSAHEFHISKCIVEYAPEQQSLQIMLHLFIDDFELALAQSGIENLKLATEKETEDADQHIFDYLQDHIKFDVNSKPVFYEFVGKENSEDLIGLWIYLEVEDIKMIESINVFNDLFMEIFDDQQNLVQLKIPGEPNGILILSKEKTSDKVDF